MAVLENGFPFDNVEYDATALGAWLCTRTRGVFSADGHYTVSAAGGMQVNVSSGVAWLKMNEQWGMVAPNPATIALDVDPGDTILNRIDVVCLRIDKNQSVQEVVIKKGEIASSPAYPALVRDLNYDEVFLAAISVPAGATELSADLLTDLRVNETYCGIMRDGVTGIPTAQIQAQAEALIQLVADELARLNAGTEVMLKTEYAPDATATLTGTDIAITSTYPHPQVDYHVEFSSDFDFPPGATVTIDGDPVELLDNEGVAFTGVAWRTGDFVQIRRMGSRARVLSPLTNITIESGSNANGNYTKFPDGTLTCTKKMFFPSVSITTGHGGFYLSALYNVGAFSQEFVGEYVLSMQYRSGSSSAFVYKGDGTDFYLARGISGTVTNAVVDVMAVGRWR